VATVYGRYHYVMDVFAGILIAVIGCWIGSRLSSGVGCDAKRIRKSKRGR
jgi:membrane-associated phospholipid phosphatase